MKVFFVMEQNNQLVMLNHHVHPSKSAQFPGIKVASSNNNNWQGREHGHGITTVMVTKELILWLLKTFLMKELIRTSKKRK